MKKAESKIKDKSLSFKQKVGLRVKMLRESEKDTQESLAAKIDVGSERIGRVERGTYSLTEDLLEKLCKIYNVPESYFYSFDTIEVSENKKMLVNSIKEELLKCKIDDLIKFQHIVKVFLPDYNKKLK